MQKRTNLNLDYLKNKLNESLENFDITEINYIYVNVTLDYDGDLITTMFFDSSDFNKNGTRWAGGEEVKIIIKRILENDLKVSEDLQSDISSSYEEKWINIENDDYDDDYNILSIENLLESDSELTNKQKEWIIHNIDSTYWPKEWMEEFLEKE